MASKEGSISGTPARELSKMSRTTFGHAVLRALARQHWLRLGIRYRMLRPFVHWSRVAPSPFECDFHGLRYTGDLSRHIDWHVYFFGAYEREELLLLEALARSGRNRVALDIGANVGQHTLFLSQHFTRVHAFEPYSVVRDLLRQKLQINDLDNVTVHPVALGSESSRREYFLADPRNDGVGTFVSSPPHVRDSAVAMLPIVAGDDYITEMQITDIDLLKIDVEGFEREVLKGLTFTLQVNRPVVLVEINAEAKAHFGSERGFLELFPENYAVAKIATNVPTALLLNRPGVFFKSFANARPGNYLVWPKEHKQWCDIVRRAGRSYVD